MVVREAQDRDVDEIIDIYMQINELHENNRPDVFKIKDIQKNRNEILEILEDEKFNVYVATNEKEIIYGIIIINIKNVKEHRNLKDTKILWVEDIGIKEEYKRNGIGKVLMDKAKEIAKYENCSRIELNCWNFNKNAIKFYNKVGMSTQRRIMEIVL